MPAKSRFGEVSLLDCNDSFTHNLVQAFLKLGAPVTVFRTHQITMEEVTTKLGDYLVLSPGPGKPEDAGIAKSLYNKIKGKLPVLGVCLGMQVINEVFGGSTISSPLPVHGKTCNIFHNNSGIFTGISSPTSVARYHSLMITPSPSLEIQSIFNEVVMAFRMPELITTAVQFHPESFLTTDGTIMLLNFLEGKI